MAPLTWRNVDPPDASAAVNLMGMAQRGWAQAFDSIGANLDNLRNAQQENRSAEALGILAGVRGESDVDGALQRINQMIRPQDMTTELQAAILGLRENAQGYDTRRAALARAGRSGGGGSGGGGGAAPQGTAALAESILGGTTPQATPTTTTQGPAAAATPAAAPAQGLGSVLLSFGQQAGQSGMDYARGTPTRPAAPMRPASIQQATPAPVEQPQAPSFDDFLSAPVPGSSGLSNAARGTDPFAPPVSPYRPAVTGLTGATDDPFAPVGGMGLTPQTALHMALGEAEARRRMQAPEWSREQPTITEIDPQAPAFTQAVQRDQREADLSGQQLMTALDMASQSSPLARLFGQVNDYFTASPEEAAANDAARTLAADAQSFWASPAGREFLANNPDMAPSNGTEAVQMFAAIQSSMQTPTTSAQDTTAAEPFTRTGVSFGGVTGPTQSNSQGPSTDPPAPRVGSSLPAYPGRANEAASPDIMAGFISSGIGSRLRGDQFMNAIGTAQENTATARQTARAEDDRNIERWGQQVATQLLESMAPSQIEDWLAQNSAGYDMDAQNAIRTAMSSIMEQRGTRYGPRTVAPDREASVIINDMEASNIFAEANNRSLRATNLVDTGSSSIEGDTLLRQMDEFASDNNLDISPAEIAAGVRRISDQLDVSPDLVSNALSTGVDSGFWRELFGGNATLDWGRVEDTVRQVASSDQYSEVRFMQTQLREQLTQAQGLQSEINSLNGEIASLQRRNPSSDNLSALIMRRETLMEDLRTLHRENTSLHDALRSTE